MDIIVQSNSLKHILRLFDRSTQTKPFHEFEVKKPLCPKDEPILMPFPRALPEDVGVCSRLIADFIRELYLDRDLDMHGVMIIKDGKLICDAQFGAYRSEFWHAEYSLGKSVTAMAIGMLIDDGLLSLDDRVVKILDKKVPPLSQMTHRSLTVRHLLTMTCGCGFSEMGAVVEEKWIKGFFESLTKGSLGSTFSYNSLNTFILSAIVREISGKSVSEFLKPRLFDPLGITAYHFEKGPDGNDICGWGLYMRREDVAKLGQLFLDLGMWQGKRIISERWIKESTEEKIKTPDSLGDYNYGYHIWTHRDGKSYMFNGMFGQDMIAFPEKRLIIVSNAGIEQLFQQSRYYPLIKKYFGDTEFETRPIKPKKGAKKALNAILSEITGEKKSLFERKNRLPKYLSDAIGKVYYTDPSKSGLVKMKSIFGTENIGIVPLAEQVVRNHYTKGISRLGIIKDGGGYALRIFEKDDVITLPFELERNVYTVIKTLGTEYHTATLAQARYNEDDRGVLKLRVSFPEIANTKLIKIYFDEDKIDVKMEDLPGMGLMKIAIDAAEEGLKDKKGVSEFISKLDADILYFKIKSSVKAKFRMYEE